MKKAEVKGYKGFNTDLTCRGYQFIEGQTFKHESEISVCNSGFHFCENPIDIFAYYLPGNSVFHAVTGTGDIARHDADSKVVCSEITIGASIRLHDLIADGIKFFFNREYLSKNTKHSTGDRSASSATGDRSASVCTGINSQAMAGKYGCIALAFHNQPAKRVEMRCAEVGCGDGTDGKLKAEVWYKLDQNGNFVELAEGKRV